MVYHDASGMPVPDADVYLNGELLGSTDANAKLTVEIDQPVGTLSASHTEYGRATFDYNDAGSQDNAADTTIGLVLSAEAETAEQSFSLQQYQQGTYHQDAPAFTVLVEDSAGAPARIARLLRASVFNTHRPDERQDVTALFTASGNIISAAQLPALKNVLYDLADKQIGLDFYAEREDGLPYSGTLYFHYGLARVAVQVNAGANTN